MFVSRPPVASALGQSKIVDVVRKAVRGLDLTPLRQLNARRDVD